MVNYLEYQRIFSRGYLLKYPQSIATYHAGWKFLRNTNISPSEVDHLDSYMMFSVINPHALEHHVTHSYIQCEIESSKIYHDNIPRKFNVTKNFM